MHQVFLAQRLLLAFGRISATGVIGEGQKPEPQVERILKNRFSGSAVQALGIAVSP